MIKILSGKVLAKQIEKDLKKEISLIKEKRNETPKLVAILVGEHQSSIKYVKMKKRVAERIGVQFIFEHLSEETTTEELIKIIEKYNKKLYIDGIFLQHPLPKHINSKLSFDAINPNKDVDGTTSYSLGEILKGSKIKFYSATTLAIKTLLEYYNINVTGKEVLVIGKSIILGKPISMMLLNKGATITIAHKQTFDLKKISKRADVIISCTGNAKLLNKHYLKKNVIVIDAGYNEIGIGDLDVESSKKKLKAYSPVPGGVGPLTIASLLQQTLKAFKERVGKNES